MKSIRKEKEIVEKVKSNFYEDNCRAALLIEFPSDSPAGIGNDIIANLNDAEMAPKKNHNLSWQKIMLGFKTSNIALDARNCTEAFLQNVGIDGAKLNIVKLHQ